MRCSANAVAAPSLAAAVLLICPRSHTQGFTIPIVLDGDADLLPLTQHIVSMAPVVPACEFRPARPPRLASLEFTIGTDSHLELEIDARAWRYVLFRYRGDRFDIVVEQSNLVTASSDERYTATIVLLDGLLGEAKRLRRIRDVAAVRVLTPEQNTKASPVTNLSAHLDLLAD